MIYLYKMADIKYSETNCGPCLKIGKWNMAKVYCEMCDEFQCPECVRVHDQYALMAGHTFKYLMSPMSLVTAQSKNLLTCEVHNKPYEIFCDDHQFLCCSFCAVESHRACKHVQAIGPCQIEKKINSSDIIGSIKETKGRVFKTLESVQGICEALQGKLVKVSDFLNLLENKTRLHVSTCNTDKINELKEHENTQLSKGKDLTDICKKMYGMSSMYKGVIYRVTLKQCFVVHKAIRPKLADMLKETDKLLSDFQQIVVSVSLKKRYLDVVNFKQVPNIILTKNALKGCPNKSEFTPSQCYKITNKPIMLKEKYKRISYRKIDFLREGRLVLAERWNNLVCVVNENMEEMISLKIESHPLDIAVIDECTVVVSPDDPETISVCHIDNSDTIVLSRTLLGHFQDDSEGSYYDSICKYTDDTVIVSPKLLKRVAHLFNIRNGRQRKFQKHLPKKVWKFSVDTATVAFIKNRNLLVVAERRKNMIYICDLSNDTADHITVTDKRIQDPRGMAVASNDCVFVCCYKSHKIVQISPNGHVLCAFRLPGLFYPTDVCFSSDGKKMFILSTDLHKVFVCELRN